MSDKIIYKAHPWHGISQGESFPEIVRAFIEIVPTDTVKYEVDKESGYLSLDRPQKFSNIVPSLYGFLPKSYCGPKMAELTNKALVRTDVEGDGDPLDICILTEKDVTHGDIIARARPIGGLRLLDHNQADDKIIAVLRHDVTYSGYNDISELPKGVVNRLKHYFLTYKDMPASDLNSERPRKVEIVATYGREEAYEVIRCSLEDYKSHFNSLEEILRHV